MLGHRLFQRLMERVHCIGDGLIIPKMLQLSVILEELLFPIQRTDQVHGGYPVLGDTQPLFRPVAVLIELYGSLK